MTTPTPTTPTTHTDPPPFIAEERVGLDDSKYWLAYSRRHGIGVAFATKARADECAWALNAAYFAGYDRGVDDNWRRQDTWKQSNPAYPLTPSYATPTPTSPPSSP